MYKLHYAPDNASLIVRLVLEEIGAPYELALVDRAMRQQDSAAYRKVNPTGLIPALETHDGPIFETGAILLWLSERHGLLAPAPGNKERAAFLKWLFFLSNTLHSDLRQMFYPVKYVGNDPEVQDFHHDLTGARIMRHYALLDAFGMAERPSWLSGTQPSVLGYYLAVLLRWSALYPAGNNDWFDIEQVPYLQGLAERLERRPAAVRCAEAEGLGATPFSRPGPARPPEGSVL